MKKLFTTLVVVLSATMMLTAENVKHLWASTLEVKDSKEKAQTYIYYMRKSADGCVYTFSQYGSHGLLTEGVSDPDSVLEPATFLGQSYLGAPYEGNGYTYNTVITKFNGAGKVKWSAFSDRGYVETSASCIIPTSDGGVVLAAMVKVDDGQLPLEQNTYLLRMRITDGNGQAIDSMVQRVPWKFATIDATNRWHAVIVKFDANGKVVASRLIENEKTGTTRWWTFMGGAADSKDNFYLQTLTALNSPMPLNATDTLKTDRQAVAVLKFDASCNYVKNACTSGFAVGSANSTMTIENDNLYLTFPGNAVANTTLNFGDFAYTPKGNKANNIYLVRMDTALNVMWMNELTAQSGAAASTQTKGIAVDGEHIFISGGINGVFVLSNEDKVGRTGTYGTFLIRCSAADGASDKGYYYQPAAISLGTDVHVKDNVVYLFSYEYGNKNSGITSRFSHGIELFTTDLDLIAAYPLAQTTSTGTSSMAMSISSNFQFLGDTIITAGRLYKGQDVAVTYAENLSYNMLINSSLAMGHILPHVYTVSGIANDTLRGSVTGSGQYLADSVATLTATPATGYHFAGWSNGSTDNPLSFVAEEDTALTASFEINVYELTVATNDAAMGAVSGGGSYSHGTKVTVAATPATGYHFVSWSNGSTESTLQFNIESDTALTATFAINVYNLTLSVNDEAMGTVSGAGSYNHGTAVTLTATPATGYHFVSWSNGSTESTLQFSIESDTALTATFAINVYDLTLSVNDEAMGSVSGAGSYNHGTAVTITATPATGYRFVAWSDGETAAERVLTLTESVSLTAIFEVDDTGIAETALRSSIRVEDGRLLVSNDSRSLVSVIDAAGRVVARSMGELVSVQVPAGIYMVAANGSVVRVIVK